MIITSFFFLPGIRVAVMHTKSAFVQLLKQLIWVPLSKCENRHSEGFRILTKVTKLEISPAGFWPQLFVTHSFLYWHSGSPLTVGWSSVLCTHIIRLNNYFGSIRELGWTNRSGIGREEWHGPRSESGTLTVLCGYSFECWPFVQS